MTKLLKSILVLTLLMLASTSAMASMTVHFSNSYSPVTYGGEFTLTVNGSDPVGIYLPGQSFQTFCLEHNEYVSLPGDYRVDAINTAAVGGGVGAVNGSDPLNEETAYLFTKFYEGSLITTGGAAYTKANQDSLQRAIWLFEQEITAADPGYSADAQAKAWVADALNATAGPNPTWDGLGNVRALNLSYLNGSPAQDQLVIINPTTVPAPGALILASMGMALVGWLRRRRAF